MTKITVDLSDPVHQWLCAEAREQGLSLEQLVASCLQAQRNRSMPNKDEVDVLGILQNVSVKRGWVVSARKLWTVWGIRGSASELELALRGLMAKQFVELAQGGGYALTELGYYFQRRSGSPAAGMLLRKSVARKRFFF